MGTSSQPLDVPCLVDTGACQTVIRMDVAEEYWALHDQPKYMEKLDYKCASVTGHTIHSPGMIDVAIKGLGPVRAMIVDKSFMYKFILGWDLMCRHSYSLTRDMLSLAGHDFPVKSYEIVRGGTISAIVSDSERLAHLLYQFRDLFGQPGSLQAAKVEPMEIHVEAPPVYQRPYPMPHMKRAAADKEIDVMLQMGVIRPSSSPYASPILLVPKKDGSIRFCIDYRRLNNITTKDRWPLPRIQDIFDQLGGSAYFSTLDMRSGYWQVPLAKQAIPKSAFVCHRGQFEWTRMPFGLANAPSHYQRVMSKILGKFIGKFLFVFLDDIVIYSPTAEEHFRHLKLVFETLAKANLTLKQSKCNFFQTHVDLLGYVVGKDGYSAQSSKTAAIRQQPPPDDQTELRRFLGMASYYRQLVPGFAQIASPLTSLLKKDADWRWGVEQDIAFQQLKDMLTSDRVMAFPRLDQPYILYTDACNYAIGAILCQEDEDGIERPIQYISAQLTPTQRRWAVIEKEAYAVVYALRKLRTYLLGAKVTVYTDHKPLLCFFIGEIDNTKIQRWAVLLAEFAATIKYRPGQNNVRADMLSRIKQLPMAVLDVQAEWVAPDDTDTPPVPPLADELNREELSRLQQQEFPDEWQSAADGADGYVLCHGLLYSVRRPNKDTPRFPRLLLPERFRENIVNDRHITGGHCGVIKTMYRVQDHYVWPGMRRDIRNYYMQCGHCRVHEARPDRPTMGEMPLATVPGQVWSMDLIGPLVASEYGNHYVLTMLDHYSGWPEAYPLPGKSNAAVWRWLRNDFLPRHGCPRLLISDQGTEFKSPAFDQWLQHNGIHHRRVTPYHPQANGRVERLNRTLKSMLRKLVDGRTHRWEDCLGHALWGIRTNVSSVTNHSPFMLHHARPARAPVRDMLDIRNDPDYSYDNRVRLQSINFRKVAEATRDSRRLNRTRINQRANAKDIEVGDYVILRAPNPLPLAARWDHVYIVSAVRGYSLIITHPETGVEKMVHREHVKLVDPDIAWEAVAPRPRRRPIPRAPVPHQPQPMPRDPPAPEAPDVQPPVPAPGARRPAVQRQGPPDEIEVLPDDPPRQDRPEEARPARDPPEDPDRRPDDIMDIGEPPVVLVHAPPPDAPPSPDMEVGGPNQPDLGGRDPTQPDTSADPTEPRAPIADSTQPDTADGQRYNLRPRRKRIRSDTERDTSSSATRRQSVRRKRRR